MNVSFLAIKKVSNIKQASAQDLSQNSQDSNSPLIIFLGLCHPFPPPRLPFLLLQLFGEFVREDGRDAEEGAEADEDVEEESVGLPGRPQQERVQGALP